MDTDTGSFENWWAAAELYCSERPEMGFWEFQVQEFASDIAWRMEGIPFTEAMMDTAYEDWTNGCSPYSVHSLATPRNPEDGYDMWGKWAREEARHRVELSEYALTHGININVLHEFINSYVFRNDIYFNEGHCDIAIVEWNQRKESEKEI